jgi:hypothetical protein
MVLRIAGFSILILLVILVPIYKMFGISNYFWAALAVCVLFILWAAAIYKKLYSNIECPKCHLKITQLHLRKTGRCSKCGAELKFPDH